MARPVVEAGEGIGDTIDRATHFTLDQKKVIKKVINRLVGKNTSGSVSYSSNAAFADVAPFTFTVKAGIRYRVDGYFMINSNASGGIKIGSAITNQVSPSPYILTGTLFAAGASVTGTIGTPGSIVGSTSAIIAAQFGGVITPDRDGVFSIQAAQNASFATPTIILAGSWVKVFEVK